MGTARNFSHSKGDQRSEKRAMKAYSPEYMLTQGCLVVLLVCLSSWYAFFDSLLSNACWWQEKKFDFIKSLEERR